MMTLQIAQDDVTYPYFGVHFWWGGLTKTQNWSTQVILSNSNFRNSVL